MSHQSHHYLSSPIKVECDFTVDHALILTLARIKWRKLKHLVFFFGMMRKGCDSNCATACWFDLACLAWMTRKLSENDSLKDNVLALTSLPSDGILLLPLRVLLSTIFQLCSSYVPTIQLPSRCAPACSTSTMLQHIRPMFELYSNYV